MGGGGDCNGSGGGRAASAAAASAAVCVISNASMVTKSAKLNNDSMHTTLHVIYSIFDSPQELNNDGNFILVGI